MAKDVQDFYTDNDKTLLRNINRDRLGKQLQDSQAVKL